jgi:pimeloyl-ACP methyl ester carboxylesterase
MAAPALHVEVHGPAAARAVTLAHGFGGSARNWRPQLRTLRGRFRAVVYDARGHARSEAPAEPAAYRIRELVADLLRASEAGGDPRPVLGGLSLGAAVALRAALAHPQCARALVLASHPAARGDRSERSGPPIPRSEPQASEAVGPGSGHGVAASALEFADAIEQDGLEAAGARFAWGPGAGLDSEARALVRQGFLEHRPHALAHTLRECLARLEPVETLAPQLAELRLPVLVVAGERDPVSLPVSRTLSEALPGAQLVVIPGAGHVVNLAAPAAFDAALLDFLERLEG